jgi:cobalamin biosynthesis protein CbiD
MEGELGKVVRKFFHVERTPKCAAVAAFVCIMGLVKGHKRFAVEVVHLRRNIRVTLESQKHYCEQ